MIVCSGSIAPFHQAVLQGLLLREADGRSRRTPDIRHRSIRGRLPRSSAKSARTTHRPNRRTILLAAADLEDMHDAAHDAAIIRALGARLIWFET